MAGSEAGYLVAGRSWLAGWLVTHVDVFMVLRESSTLTHSHPHSPTVIHTHPQLSTLTYSHPRSPTAIHTHLQSSTLTHSHPQPCLLWPACFDCRTTAHDIRGLRGTKDRWGPPHLTAGPCNDRWGPPHSPTSVLPQRHGSTGPCNDRCTATTTWLTWTM